MPLEKKEWRNKLMISKGKRGRKLGKFNDNT